MYKILDKKRIAPDVTMTEIAAPRIAGKGKPGQFVILRLYEEGERIPLTIADADPEKGTITVISQRVGKSTAYLEDMPASEEILDLVGPLGHPTAIKKYGNVLCVGGGIGIAPIHPIARGMREAGNHVTSILGARTKDLLILEDYMRRVSDSVYICTDDGSYGRKGFVTDVLKELVNEGKQYDLVVAIGPIPMMNAVTKLTKEINIPTIVSLNSIMVDGTGMCGACRVSVDGKTKFTCVDGPEFDGHKVDFEELLYRLKIFSKYETSSQEQYEDNVENPNCIKKRIIDEQK